LLYGTDPKKELEKAAKGISGDPTGDLDELALKFLGLESFMGLLKKPKRFPLSGQRRERFYSQWNPEGNTSFLRPVLSWLIESSPLLVPSPILMRIMENYRSLWDSGTIELN